MSRTTSQRAQRLRISLVLEELETRRLLSGFTPTDAEQLFLQELNAARANPAAYGASIGVDLSYVAPSAPLAFNPDMIQAARLHAQDMSDNNYVAHVSPSGADPGERLTAAGVSWSSYAESIAAGNGYTEPSQALAALITDAGVADLGHRDQLLAIGSSYTGLNQVGIGVVQDGSGEYQNYYTIDTAATVPDGTFLTGVVYTDANHDGQYDMGEGLGGVTISVAGGPSVTTWSTGGYSLEVNPGTYTVTASGGGLAAPITQTVTVGLSNVEVDFAAGGSSGGGPAPTMPTGTGSAFYAVTPSQELYEYQPASGWTQIGNAGTIKSVSTATDATGSTVAFAISTAGGLYRFSNAAGWSQIGGPGTVRSVTAGTDAAGQADAFVLTTGGALCEYDPLIGWSTIGSAHTVSSMSAAGEGQVYVVGADGSVLVYETAYGWLRLSGSDFGSAVTAVTDAAGNTSVFVVTQAHALYRYNQQAGWVQLGGDGTVTSALAGTDFTGQADVAVLTNNGSMSEYEIESGWTTLQRPGVVRALAGEMPGQFIAVNMDDAVIQHDDHWGWSDLTSPGFAS